METGSIIYRNGELPRKLRPLSTLLQLRRNFIGDERERTVEK